MNLFLDLTAILLVTFASLQLGLVLTWGLLSLLLNSIHRSSFQTKE